VKPHHRLIALLGWLVPRALRADWRREWTSELQHSESRLPEGELLRRSASAFWDALALQQRRWEANVTQDLRYAARMLVRQPGFSLVAIVTLGLGIGANTAIFSLLDKLIVRALPVAAAERLVTFASGGAPLVLSNPWYEEIRERATLVSVAAFTERHFALSDGGRGERVVGALVSGNYFRTVGVEAARGRPLSDEDDRVAGGSAVAVISHGLWRRAFASEPALVGRRVLLNGHAFEIVGVLAPTFSGITRGVSVDVYVPRTMAPQTMPGGEEALTATNWGWLRVIGRLAPGATMAQAQAALQPFFDERGFDRKGAQKKDTFNLGSLPGVRLRDGRRGYTQEVEDLELPLTMLMGAVGFVLLIACANIMNLLLARAVTRRREMAVRIATGASHARIVRQLLTEAALLAGLGGAAGVFIGSRLAHVLAEFQQRFTHMPHSLDPTLDGRALALAFAVCVAATLAFGIVPARRALTADVLPGLKADAAPSGPRAWRTGGALILAQTALSVVVLIGAGLCLKSLRALHAIDTGLEPSKVLTASFQLELHGYDRERGRQFTAELVRRVAALPGVERASLANIVAFSDGFWIAGAMPEGYRPAPGERMAFDLNAVGPGYFSTIGLPLVSGRDFTAADSREAAPVLIVNETVARRYWPGQNAVGQRMNRGGRSSEIVAVVRDGRVKRPADAVAPAIYLPLEQNFVSQLTLHVRAIGDPAALLGPVRRELQALDPSVAVYNLQTLEAQRKGSLYAERLSAVLLSMLGALALVLVAIGLYGLLSYAVSQRTREIGIRAALGARRRDLLHLVIGRGVLLTIVGSIAGIAASFALTGLIRGVLFQVSPMDPQVFVLVPAGLIAVALVACWLPARRAARLNPLAALRHE
jgi:predicted permease